ncbi:MAG: hypothetical protein KBS54_05840 [Synergistaceae bacterium]|nr:hypothetical protein [Candidatus Equadaptatus faecalis]
MFNKKSVFNAFAVSRQLSAEFIDRQTDRQTDRQPLLLRKNFVFLASLLILKFQIQKVKLQT